MGGNQVVKRTRLTLYYRTVGFYSVGTMWDFSLPFNILKSKKLLASNYISV